MIKAIFSYSNKNIISFTISGHAESVKKGENDLVCAGVSSVVFGILNSLDEKYLIIKIEENNISINIKELNQKNSIILDVLFTSLKTIEDRNEKYLKIFKKEQ